MSIYQWEIENAVGSFANCAKARLLAILGNVDIYHSHFFNYNSTYTFSATVNDNHKFSCYLELDRDHHIQDWECDCKSYHDRKTMCVHCASIAYAITLNPGKYLQGQVKNPDKDSDLIVRNLIGSYQSEREKSILSLDENLSSPVSLIPTLVLGKNCTPGLSFTVGSDKQYILRGVVGFAKRMENREFFSYGKGLAFSHSPENFTEKSFPMAQFILSQVRSSPKEARHAGVVDMWPQERRVLAVQKDGWDTFFDMIDGETLHVEKDGVQFDVSICDAQSLPRVKIEPIKGGIRFFCEGFEYVEGLRYVYVLTDNTRVLVKIPLSAVEEGMPLLRALRDNSYQIFVAKKDLNAFCAAVLPMAKKTLSLADETNQLEPYTPPEMKATLYLDLPEREKATCNAEVVYGKNKYSLFEGSSSSLRDQVKEARLSALVKRFFPDFEEKDALSVVSGENALYTLLKEGLPLLSKAADIHVTDAFQSINVRKKTAVTVGVSLDSGIMNVVFSAEGLNRDEISDILSSYREKKKYHRLKDGSFLDMDEGIESLARLADVGDLSEKELREGKAKMPLFRAAAVDAMLHDREGVRFERDARFRSLLLALRNPNDSEIDPPESLRGILRPYQQDGFRWMKTLSDYGFGGILADDMGLGKTLQVLSVLESERLAGSSEPSLVICPASLVYNWEQEAKRFTPEIPVRTIVGTASQRKNAIASIENGELVITSYDMLRRDTELYENQGFLYQIVDEAQFIKNHLTVNAKSVKAITAKHRFALTGTPVENRLSELWSIFDYVMPGYLFGYTKFRKRLELPIVHNDDETAKNTLSRMIAPFVLRRLKKDVLTELPPKTESVMRAEMGDKQRDLYTAAVSVAKMQMEQELKKAESEQSRVKILALLTRLRQICCDPSLCYENYDGESCKLDMCLELVREAMDGGHRTLLFSQFTQMLAILAKKLEEAQIPYFLLQGDTPKEERLRLVEEFNAGDVPVFLISLKAGGTGLNLTGADTVIHYDPWWNIAAENQASDRAHRIGQDKNVQVYRLIVKNTVEEGILKLHDMKKELSDAVLSGAAGGDSFTLTDEDIEMLLSQNE